jgi:hypothetical protein
MNGWLYDKDAKGREVMRRCKKCLLTRLAAQSGRDNCTWATWQDVPELRKQAPILRAWKFSAWSAFLHADRAKTNYGAGKTHALLAFATDWIESGKEVAYWYHPDLVERHRQAISDHTLALPNLGEYRHLLVLDDVGAEGRSDWTREFVDRILDQRYRRNLPTLISSNLDMAAFEERYPRALSRLCEGLRLTWSASDWRRRDS